MSNHLKEINVYDNAAIGTTFLASIDSLNVSSFEDPLQLFANKKNYEIVLLKRKKSGYEDKAKYFSTFGSSMYNTYLDKEGKEQKVCPYLNIFSIHASANAVQRVVVPVAKKNSYILEFPGLQQYDATGRQMVQTLQDLWPKMQDFSLNRIDIAIDFWGDLPLEIEKHILRTREKVIYENSVYYNTPKQKTKRNTYVQIIAYNKTAKDKHLSEYKKITRLEFIFRSKITKFKLRDFRDAKKSMIRYISKNAGIQIEIKNISRKPSKLISKKILTKVVERTMIQKLENTVSLLEERSNAIMREMEYLKIMLQLLRAERIVMQQMLYFWRERNVMKREIASMNKNIQKKLHQHSTMIELLTMGMEHMTADYKQIVEQQNYLKSCVLNQSSSIEWTTLSIIAKKIGLTKDAIRKQLQNGEFEEGVDFKHEGNKIVVHQGAIGRIQRKRRSPNG